jgi:hypothetical protein
MQNFVKVMRYKAVFVVAHVAGKPEIVNEYVSPVTGPTIYEE